MQAPRRRSRIGPGPGCVAVALCNIDGRPMLKKRRTPFPSELIKLPNPSVLPIH